MHAGEFGETEHPGRRIRCVLHARGGVWGKRGERNLKLSCSPCTRGSLAVALPDGSVLQVFSMHAGEFGKKGRTQFETFVFSMHAGEFGQHGSRDLELRCVLHARGGVWIARESKRLLQMCSPCTRGSLDALTQTPLSQYVFSMHAGEFGHRPYQPIHPAFLKPLR